MCFNYTILCITKAYKNSIADKLEFEVHEKLELQPNIRILPRAMRASSHTQLDIWKEMLRPQVAIKVFAELKKSRTKM